MEHLTISYDSGIKEHLLWFLNSLPKEKLKIEGGETKKERLLQSLKTTRGILASKNIDPIAYQKECREER